MTSKELIFAALLLGGLATTGSAVKASKQWSGAVKGAQTRLSQADRELEEMRHALADANELKSSSKSNDSQQSVDEAFSEAMLGLKAALSAGGIKSYMMSVPSMANASKRQAVQSLLIPMPKTAKLVKYIDIDIKGEYSNYSSLQHFLSQVQSIPLSIKTLKIAESSFQLIIRLYVG